VAGLAPEARVELRDANIVMAGHQRERVFAQMTRPFHDFLVCSKTWMPGTRPGMTKKK
jgi:hypothetical protein